MKILVVIPVTDIQKERLEAQAPDAVFVYCLASDVTKDQVSKADIIIGNVAIDLIRGTKKLKWIQLNNAGTDGYCVEGVLSNDTILTNASGAYGLAISEYMIGVLFMLKKKLHTYYLNQQKHLWKSEGQVQVVSGNTTLVIGLGDIGREFAKKMDALGSYVIGIRKSDSPRPDYVKEQYTLSELDTVISRADIIALCLPANKETVHVLNKENFALIKKTAVLLNVGRGTAIDTKVLYDALVGDKIAGACIDVCNPEPVPEDHEIWDAPNIIITPHISGRFSLAETLEKIVAICVQNLGNYMEGRPLINVVNKHTGYPG